MKSVKGIICFILSVSLVFVLTAPAFASKTVNNENYDCLVEQGFSESFLNNQTASYLQKMVNIIGDKEIVNIKTTVVGSTESGIATVADIGSSLKLEIVAAEMCEKNSNKISSVLTGVSWEWSKNKPVYRGKDAVTVNWDPAVFTYADGFYGQDLYKTNASDSWTVFKEYNDLAAANQGGIGTWTDLKAFKNYVGGSMLFVLAPASPITKGTSHSTGVHVQYVHSAAPFNGLSISAFNFGVGITWNSSCNTKSATHYIRYSK